MQFQPSELAKVFVILLLAKMLEKRKGEYLPMGGYTHR
ncbi:hypothetical protein [Paenibacillus sp. yr247]